MTHDDLPFTFDSFSDDFDDVQPNRASDRRRLVLLLFDLSGSMGVSRDGVKPVQALNTQIRQWLPEVRRKGAGELRDVEFAVLTFGNGVVQLRTAGRQVQFTEDGAVEQWMAGDEGAFVPAAKLDMDDFEAGGSTPIVTALQIAIALGDQRAEFLGAAGLTTGQVRLILFTDGSPNDRHLPRDAWRGVAVDLAERRRKRRNQVFAFGVPGADARILRALASDDGYFPLEGFDFVKLLELIMIATSAENPYESLHDVMHSTDEGDGPVGGR